jgi:hypothetical protein
MSDGPFLPPKPLMSALKARNLSRLYKAFAEQLHEQGVEDEAARMERTALWWMSYANALSQIPPGAIER